jgi:hypothetical protein
MPTSPGPSTSNNWGWADILKKVFTLVELGPLQKWNAKPISNKEWQHTQKGEWQHTQNKKWVTTHSRKGEHYSSREFFQEDHEGSSWENRKKQDWA